MVVSGDCWCWDGESLVAGTGSLASLVTETVEEACLRCWFSGVLLAWLILSDGTAHSGVGIMVVLVDMRLPLLGVCSQETSTPCTWSMVAFAFSQGGGTVRWAQCDGSSRSRVLGRYQKPVLPVLMIEALRRMTCGGRQSANNAPDSAE